jgi:hypothetical protein
MFLKLLPLEARIAMVLPFLLYVPLLVALMAMALFRAAAAAAAVGGGLCAFHPVRSYCSRRSSKITKRKDELIHGRLHVRRLLAW